MAIPIEWGNKYLFLSREENLLADPVVRPYKLFDFSESVTALPLR